MSPVFWYIFSFEIGGSMLLALGSVACSFMICESIEQPSQLQLVCLTFQPLIAVHLVVTIIKCSQDYAETLADAERMMEARIKWIMSWLNAMNRKATGLLRSMSTMLGGSEMYAAEINTVKELKNWNTMLMDRIRGWGYTEQVSTRDMHLSYLVQWKLKRDRNRKRRYLKMEMRSPKMKTDSQRMWLKGEEDTKRDGLSIYKFATALITST